MEDLDTQIDEGFSNIEDGLPDGFDLHTSTADSEDVTVGPLIDTESEDKDEVLS